MNPDSVVVTAPLLQATLDVDVATGLFGGAVGAFLTTLVVGAILVTLAPDYTEQMMDTVRDEPVGSFVYGFVALVFVVLVTFVLFITIIGILLAIPFALLAGVLWAVGAAIAYLAIAERLLGHVADREEATDRVSGRERHANREDGWLKPLLVAAALNGALALTGIGGIISFGVGAAGFGAILRNWLE